MKILRKLCFPIFWITVSLIVWFGHSQNSKSASLQGDQFRYINYAVSMSVHGTFGLMETGQISEAPAPGNANAPLYPMMIAGIMFLDSNFSETLKCILPQRSEKGCDVDFTSFFAVQLALSIFSIFLIYLISLRFSGNKNVAYISALLAACSSVFSDYTYQFMTETLVLPGFFLLLLFCLLFYQEKKLKWLIFVSLALAFLTLVRPSYLYLFFGFVLFFVGLAIVKRSKFQLLHLSVFVFAFVIGVMPWAIRNKIQFDTFALTTGGYAEAILIQRTNYNQMSWPEIGVAMIYWLPGFGDSLSEKIFPEHLYKRLGWDKGSYYKIGYRDPLEELTEQLGERDQVLSHLIKEEVLTLKHVAVSVPLAVRGTLMVKYASILGFITFILLSIQTVRRGNYALIVLALPLFFMVAFHAGLSVSIARYNLPLIVLYTLTLAYYFNFYGCRLVQKLHKK